MFAELWSLQGRAGVQVPGSPVAGVLGSHLSCCSISTWDEIRKLRVWPKGRLLLALMKTGPLRIPAHVLEAAVLVSLCQARCQGLGFPLLWGWSRERKITN